MLRILIVDDQLSIRESIKANLESEPDFRVVATANDGQSALKLARQLLPDLMLVDLEMPRVNGLELTRMIHQDLPSIKVIVLSMHDQDGYIQQSLQAGAMGYLLKNTPVQDLRAAIRFVSRGYTQFSPGLLHKVIPTVDTQPIFDRHQNREDELSLSSLGTNSSKFKTIDSLNQKSSRVRKPWQSYLPYWLVGNAVLWGLAILYLVFKNPTYTSKWAISLPASQNSSSLSIPDVGSVSSNTESPYRHNLFDPREDYKFLIRKPEIIEQAAAKVGMKRSEYGQPEIEIVDNTTMMELTTEGDTPEAAQQKAIALQNVLEQKIQQLRQEQISQTDRNLQASLARSKTALDNARQKLAEFRGSSLLGSRDKASNLSDNLEQLRRQQAETTAQLEQTKVQSARLADNLGMSAQSAKDAFALHSDSLFQQYLAEYTRASGEMVAVAAKFQKDSPNVIEKKQEVEQASNSLLERGGVLLGRTPSAELLQQLNLRTGEENDSYRGSLLKDIVALQSEADGLAAKAAELSNQIQTIESKENRLVQQDATLARLQQEVKFAETVYSSNLAKSRLAESNLYDAYPQIQVAIKPNLPRKPSSPNPTTIALGTFMGSVFLTTAIASLWASSSVEKSPLANKNHNNNNHKALTPATDLNSLLKK
ncbi:MAG: response regulator [Cyanobacteria bacterium P01_G01_bin.67]